MILAQVTAEVAVWWWTALGAGLVVGVVLVFLLHLLLARVREVEQGVAEVWRAGGHVARNTATAWLVQQTADSFEILEDEVAHLDERLHGGRN